MTLRYLKYKLVDNDTGEFLGDGVMGKNGLRHPFVAGLDVLFEGVDKFIYAQCPDDSAIPAQGSIQVVALSVVEAARAAVVDASKAALKSRVWAIAAAKRAAATAEYHPTEISAGASYKIEEARAIIAGGSGALVEAEAVARGVTALELAAKIVAAYDRLTSLEASVAGYSGKLADAVDAATSDPATALRAADTEGWLSSAR